MDDGLCSGDLYLVVSEKKNEARTLPTCNPQKANLAMKMRTD